jgi:UDP-N-acetylmuramoyl-tripeptide--D-alanyl-D-alanine ligase
MIPIRLSTVCGFVGGRLEAGSFDAEIRGVSADSREDMAQKLFVPIKGERSNGHDYILQAFENGAACAFCSETRSFPGLPVIYVSDTVEALKTFASRYRDMFGVKIVGVTGSVGKTTVKDLIAAILSVKFKTLKNLGNLNTDIGLPLTLFGLDGSHELAVLEMGMRHFGEIRELARIARPETAVITNIGVSHLENLGSREGILRAKSELIEGLPPNGAAVLNGDDDLLLTLRGKYKNIIYYGTNSDNVFYAEDIEYNGIFGIGFTLVNARSNRRIRIGVPVPGEHMVSNALCAAAVGELYRLEPEELKLGIEGFRPSGMRLMISKNPAGGWWVIDDSYNASPASMLAAFNVLSRASGRKLCVLGDMFELGDESDGFHRKLGASLAAMDFDIVLFLGEKIMLTADECEAETRRTRGKTVVIRAKDRAWTTSFLKAELRPGDTVLFKASRGMKFDELADALK